MGNSKKYNGLNKAFNIEDDTVDVEVLPSSDKNSSNETSSNEEIVNDIKKDYEYTRTNLYSLVEKGQEAIDGMIEIASETGQPRAYEVAGQLIKSVSDVTDKLMDLQKKLKDIEGEETKTTNNTTNNAIFVGSTSELSKILKQGFLNSKE